MTAAPPAIAHVGTGVWRSGVCAGAERALPEEVAVALSYDRETFAVMMASPADFEDFAVGFSLSEGIIGKPADIIDFKTVVVDDGIECRMTLAPQFREALQARRRRIAGPVGCGLCGLDSLKEVARALPKVTAAVRMPAAAIADAFKDMHRLQMFNHATHAVHAAAYFCPSQDGLLVREDIGRHNALDKLIGAAARRGLAAEAGAILLTSRVSLDLIQKAACFGTGILAAISVPTARAVREAHAAGITLIAVARDDGFEVFTHAERVVF
jgi:FdhD protein